jgi:hypothetical protein
VVNIVATDPIAVAGTNCWRWLGLTSLSPTWSNWVAPAALWQWFTNCGPKDGTFTVHRAGETNDDLAVTYSIGGTASNGVDYVTLPGIVTVPAGQIEATITVIPLTNSDTNVIKTVVLALTPSTNLPPDYRVGFPPRAEAIIVGGPWPRFMPPAAMLPGGTFHLSLAGPDGAWFRIDSTTDLLNWTPVCTNQVIEGSIDFADPDATGSAEQIYRAVPLLNPPGN